MRPEDVGSNDSGSERSAPFRRLHARLRASPAPFRPPHRCRAARSSTPSDVTIHCMVDGQSGPPLVFLHGFGTSSETWQDIRPLINQHGSFTSSTSRASAFRPSRRIATTRRTSRRTSSRPSSAITTCGTACSSDTRPGGGCAPHIPQAEGAGRPAAERARAHRSRGVSAEAAVLHRRASPACRQQAGLPLHIVVDPARYTLNRVFYNKGAITPERIARYTGFLDAPGARQSFVAAARQIDKNGPAETSAHLDEVDGRTLVIWGTHKPVIAVANAHRLRDELPHASLVLAPGSGHVPRQEEPEPVAAAILEFLRTLR